MDDLRWALTWEIDLTDTERAALARMLGRTYPAYADLFTGRRCWSWARPEIRMIGWSGDRPIAHLGVLRRFLHVPDARSILLVGDTGLVAVDPDFQGRGIGRDLLHRTTRTMTTLDLPFGFLICRPSVVPFYESGGWKLIDGQVTRMIADTTEETEVYRGPAMVLPVRSPLSDWPHGHVVDRNGRGV
ncbi:MAG: GNAT family N-acetyltransferase [Micromonosporaceae bacterium]